MNDLGFHDYYLRICLEWKIGYVIMLHGEYQRFRRRLGGDGNRSCSVYCYCHSFYYPSVLTMPLKKREVLSKIFLTGFVLLMVLLVRL
jgi:hypothetical protein